MTCAEIRVLFSDHLDGNLPHEAEDRLGKHVAACPACRQALADYEAGVGNLAGRFPDPPPGLSGRVARSLEKEALLRRPVMKNVGRWGLLAAGLAILAIGLTVGRVSAPRGEDVSPQDFQLRAAGWGPSCVATSAAVPSLDPSAWRRPRAATEPELTLTAGRHPLRLPRRLASHGPYEAVDTVEEEGATCVRLRPPLGTGLALRVRPRQKEADDSEVFLVEVDPRRVLYGRVLWHQQSLAWSLEGRADVAELLDLAREVAARARVEKPGDQT